MFFSFAFLKTSRLTVQASVQYMPHTLVCVFLIVAVLYDLDPFKTRSSSLTRSTSLTIQSFDPNVDMAIPRRGASNAHGYRMPQSDESDDDREFRNDPNDRPYYGGGPRLNLNHRSQRPSPLRQKPHSRSDDWMNDDWAEPNTIEPKGDDLERGPTSRDNVYPNQDPEMDYALWSDLWTRYTIYNDPRYIRKFESRLSKSTTLKININHRCVRCSHLSYGVIFGHKRKDCPLPDHTIDYLYDLFILLNLYQRGISLPPKFHRFCKDLGVDFQFFWVHCVHSAWIQRDHSQCPPSMFICYPCTQNMIILPIL